MKAQVQPYLFFEGRCEEAITFYKQALGAEVVMLMRFKDSPDPNMCTAGSGEKIMHATLKIGDSTLLTSDGRCEGTPQSYKGFALSYVAPTAADADRAFAALSDGGQVQMPLSKTFFSEKFGMCADKFGVGWMILVAHN